MQKGTKYLLGGLLVLLIAQAAIIIFLLAPKSEQETLLSTSGNAEANYRTGMELLLKEGTQTAKDYFQQLFDQTGEPLYFFALGWINFQGGEYEKAEKRMDFLLASQHPSQIEAYACHLKGYLVLAKNSVEESKQYFQRAETLNLEAGRFKEVFQNRIGLASCYAEEEQFIQARTILSKAYDTAVENELPMSLSHFFGLIALVEHSLGNNEAALKYEQQCYQELKNYNHDQQLAHSALRQAFYEILLGYVDQAQDHHTLALNLSPIFRENPPIMSELLSYMIATCQGKTSAADLQKVQESLQQENKPFFTRFSEKLPQWSCYPN